MTAVPGLYYSISSSVLAFMSFTKMYAVVTELGLLKTSSAAQGNLILLHLLQSSLQLRAALQGSWMSLDVTGCLVSAVSSSGSVKS